jgi:Zn-dependent protease
MLQSQTIIQLTVWIIPLILAITLHEAAHGYAALRFGDDTALRAGRISLNPIRHIDPFGTILIPAALMLSGVHFLFGYAKPVPVNFWRLHNPKRDMIWVAAAGPAMNIILALISAILFWTLDWLPQSITIWTAHNLWNSMQINVVLAVFNMLPLPPLDGGRVAVGLLPRSLGQPLAKLERWGLAIVIGVLFIVPAVTHLDVAEWVLGTPVEYLLRTFAPLTGYPFDLLVKL